LKATTPIGTLRMTGRLNYRSVRLPR